MSGAARALRVFVCHHPLVELRNAVVSGGVHRGPAAARLFADAGVDLILTGHVHNPFAFALPAPDGRTYAVGAGTLSLRTRGTPAGFSVIEANAATIEITAQGWTGVKFEPILTWSLPRRAAPSPACKRPH